MRGNVDNVAEPRLRYGDSGCITSRTEWERVCVQRGNSGETEAVSDFQSTVKKQKTKPNLLLVNDQNDITTSSTKEKEVARWPEEFLNLLAALHQEPGGAETETVSDGMDF